MVTLVKKNKHDFYEISNKPSNSDLVSYYAKKYYQEPTGQYQTGYSEDELTYFFNKGKVCLSTVGKVNTDIASLFEIGCGEGFFADFFFQKNIKNIVLNDFSDFGLQTFNPHLLQFLKKIDVCEHIDKMMKTGKYFDLISMDNVLEHVIDPEFLLNSIKSLMHEKSVLRITVPNDFSSFQNMLVREGLTKETWVSPPDHLSYFNSSNLVMFCKSIGFEVHSAQCDFPIELFLANEHSDYYEDRSRGKSAHRARVMCSNYLVNEDIDSFISMSECSAKLQYGRNVTVYLGLT